VPCGVPNAERLTHKKAATALHKATDAVALESRPLQGRRSTLDQAVDRCRRAPMTYVTSLASPLPFRVDKWGYHPAAMHRNGRGRTTKETL
jgi:hypothetical protein